MTHEPRRLAELRGLIEALCEETIDADNVARLEAFVRADPDARAFYITYMHMHAELVRELGGAEPVPGEDGRVPFQLLGSSNSEPNPVTATEVAPPPAGRSSRVLNRWMRWAAAAVFLAGAAVLGALAGSRLTLSGLTPSARNGPTLRAAAPLPPNQKVQVANGLAMVLSLERIVWERDDEPHPAAGELVGASRLRFRSGRIALVMLNGVLLDVEGPADVELVSTDRALCHKGKLHARVPEGAEGFVVAGAGTAVVDLGTEFGMNVDEGGKVQGKVFKGKVEAAVLNASGTLRRSREMKENHVFEIDPRIDHIAADSRSADSRSANFLAASKPEVPLLRLDERYREVILGAQPWGYWRFEALEHGLTPNEVPNRPPLRATGPLALSGSDAGNRCVVFAAGEPGQHLSLDGLWEPPRDPGYAVELWCLSESIAHSALVSMVAPRHSQNHQFLLELTRRERWSLHQPASVRFLHRSPPSMKGGDNLYSETLYVPYRWHHIVGQLNGDQMELFMDGEPTPAMSVDPEYINSPCQLLLGRLTLVPKHAADTSRPLVGRLDEVAVYDHALTAEEVRTHYRLGSGGTRR